MKIRISALKILTGFCSIVLYNHRYCNIIIFNCRFYFGIFYLVIFMKNTFLILGYGYTGSHVANLISRNGWRVVGTSSKSHHTNAAIIPYDREQITNEIKTATHILISIPPDENGDVVLADFSDILSLAKNLKWIGYLSSTAV